MYYKNNETKEIPDICLSIDPGLSKIGWSIVNWKLADFIDGGVIEIEKNPDNFLRLETIYNKITKLIQDNKIEFVIVEKVNFVSYRTSKIMEAYFLKAIGVITVACLNTGKMYMEVDVNTARKKLYENNKFETKCKKARSVIVTKKYISSLSYLQLIKKKKNQHIVDSVFIVCYIHKIYKESSILTLNQ